MKYLINILLFILILSGFAFGDSLRTPKSVAVDVDGYIYIFGIRGKDSYGVLKYDPQGNFVEMVNEKMYSIGTVSGTKNVVVGRWIGRKINRKDILDFSKYLKTEPRLEKIMEKVFYPEHITIGTDGEIYAIGKDIYRNHGRVGIIDPEDGHTIMAFGEFTREDKPYGLWNPRGIAVDNDGNIYIANQGPYCIKKFDKNGVFIKRWAPRGSGRGKFKSPTGIAIDKRDNSVYVLDAFIPSGVLGTAGQPEQMRIQKFTKDGKFINKWGERLGIAWNPFLVIPRITGIPEIDVPTGIAVDSKGYVYVFEKGKRRINKYDSDGKLILQWGRSGTKEGEFNFTLSSEPVGMAIDKDDNIYVADTGNNRVQKFDSNGKFLMEIKK